MFENSKFIWVEPQSLADTYGEFYLSLEYKGGDCKINLSCDSDYTLFINGKFVACNQYGDFEHFKVYDTVDVAPYLTRGKNDIAILVWYFGEDTQKYKKYAAGLIFEILDSDGFVLAASDECVLSRKSKAYQNGRKKIITPQLGYGYLYDAGKEDNWINGELTGFCKSFAVDKKCTFFKRPNKKLENKEKIYALPVKDEKTQKIFDLGKETFGLFFIECESDFSQKLTVSFGEDLVNGQVARIITIRDFSFEYVTKKGFNEYANYMLRLGCRYLQIDSEKPFIVKNTGLIKQRYPVEELKVECADKEIENIYRICVNTLNLSMAEHYMDCPWREQALYTFDSRNQMFTGYRIFKDGNAEYVKSNLTLIGNDRGEDGLLSICYPCGVPLKIPAFSLYYLLQVKEYLQFSKDVEFARSVFDKLKEIINAFSFRVKNGLVNNFCGERYWNFYDWAPLLMGTSERSKTSAPDLVINCLFVIALDCFEHICKTIEEEFVYVDLREEVKKAIKQNYFNKEKGLFFFGDDKEEFIEVGNSLAILADVCSKKEKEFICKNIVEGNMLLCTLSLKTFKYDALLSCGDCYKDYIVKEIRKEYSYMLSQGADCTWETIEGKSAFQNAGSLCHGWSALPAKYLVDFGLVKVKEN